MIWPLKMSESHIETPACLNTTPIRNDVTQDATKMALDPLSDL